MNINKKKTTLYREHSEWQRCEWGVWNDGNFVSKWIQMNRFKWNQVNIGTISSIVKYYINTNREERGCVKLSYGFSIKFLILIDDYQFEELRIFKYLFIHFIFMGKTWLFIRLFIELIKQVSEKSECHRCGCDECERVRDRETKKNETSASRVRIYYFTKFQIEHRAK